MGPLKKVLIISAALTFICCKEGTSPKQSKSAAQLNNKILNDPTLQDNPNATRPAGAFLLPSDFSNSMNLPEDSKEDFLQSLSTEEDFLSDTGDSSKSCPPLDALQFVASGKRAQLSGDIDYNACQDNSNPDFVFQKTRVKIFLELTCQNTDLSFLSGKTLGSLQTGEMEKLCANEGNVLTILSNLQMDYSIVYKVSGEPDVFSDGKMISSMQTPDGKPCSIIYKAGLSYHGSCEDNNLSIYSNGQFDSSYTKRKWNDLTSTLTGKYYNSGMISFQMNNWQGEMRYTSTETPPTYVANSKRGETASGTWQYNANSLRLQNSNAKPNLHKRINLTGKIF